MNGKRKSTPETELLKKYLSGSCTADEEQEVLHWFYSFKAQDDSELEQSSSELAEEMNLRLEKVLFADQYTKESQLADIKRSSSKITYFKRFAIAASALIIFGLGVRIVTKKIFSNTHNELASIINQGTKYKGNDILPGSYFANIIGGNGNEYANQDTSFLEISSINVDNGTSVSVQVPKAGMYKILLEDGTKVWLNSETKISFPKSFDRHERKISLSGEAYFEVAKDAERPFRIYADDTQIEVLGTVFNVNTYGDQVKTSLLEGSVKVSNANDSKFLKPGEESLVNSNSVDVHLVDVRVSAAWQRNEISFEGANLNEILDEIGRWYNIEIENLSNVGSDIKYKGGINRQNNLSKVLEILEVATSRQFEIQGRKLIVK